MLGVARMSERHCTHEREALRLRYRTAAPLAVLRTCLERGESDAPVPRDKSWRVVNVARTTAVQPSAGMCVGKSRPDSLRATGNEWRGRRASHSRTADAYSARARRCFQLPLSILSSPAAPATVAVNSAAKNKYVATDKLSDKSWRRNSRTTSNNMAIDSGVSQTITGGLLPPK